MESRVNYTVVGLFVIVLGIAFTVIFFWLSTFHHKKTYNTYLVYVQEDVTGLAVQSPVRFNGVPVGFVKTIELDPKNPQLVKLTLRINQEVPITTATVATMQLQGITGVLYVGLKANQVDAPILQAQPGQKYPVIPWEPSLLVQLSQVLPEITRNVESIGDNVQKLLDDKNLRAIENSLQNIQNFTKTLSDNSEVLNDSMLSLKKTLKNTAEASQDLPKLTKTVQKTFENLDQTVSQIKLTSKKMDHIFSTGDVAISNFTNQLLPATQQTMMQLNQTLMNLKQVSGELQRNPSMLIRGKYPHPPGPGER